MTETNTATPDFGRESATRFVGEDVANGADAVSRAPMATAALYLHPIAIQPCDIDFMGHVNNATYLTWVQEAVVAHWRHIADRDDIASHVWVAVKHEITYRKPAFLNDAIVAVVLLEQVRRESAFYDTVIRRGDDILAQIKSRWCCLDAVTLRPVRLGHAIVAKFLSPIRPVGCAAEGR